MRCENCGAAAFEGDLACGDCGRELAQERRAEPVTVAPALVIEAPPEPEPSAPIPADAPRCPLHFDAPGIATCARCGRYCCNACLPETKRRPNCPDCHERIRAETLPLQIKALRRELTVSFYFAALAILFFGTGVPMMVGNIHAGWGICFVVPQLIVAIVFTAWPRTAVAIGAIGYEFFGAVAAFAVLPTWIGGVFLMFPLMTVFRLMKWLSLMEDATALAAAPN